MFNRCGSSRDSAINSPQRTAAQEALEQAGTVIRADNGFVIVNAPLDENTDSPASQTTTVMGKKGKKKKKWPGMNYEVDLPKQHVGMYFRWKRMTKLTD